MRRWWWCRKMNLLILGYSVTVKACGLLVLNIIHFLMRRKVISLLFGHVQHDIPESQLKAALDCVVEECVSFVGVDLNTGSEALLR